MTKKTVALQRIRALFSLTRQVVHRDKKLAQRYVDLARRISMAARVPIPSESKNQICRHCKSFVLPGTNSRVRTRSRREPHVVVSCENCGRHMRIKLKGRKRGH